MADLSRKEWILTKNVMNTRGNTRETRGEHERNHSTNKNRSHTREIDEHKGEIQDPSPTKDDTKVTGSSP